MRLFEMLKPIRLEALTSLSYHGQALEAGDDFEAAPLEAAQMIQAHQARFQKKPQAAKAKRRTYKRRDVVAE
ncbi:MAG TPA: hypothetical protein VNM37_15170 [Candidatus Dormibacteraeota bacterium]|nr:hypothetical protein [Candidatus Dormibacteraeota bacterium]